MPPPSFPVPELGVKLGLLFSHPLLGLPCGCVSPSPKGIPAPEHYRYLLGTLRRLPGHTTAKGGWHSGCRGSEVITGFLLSRPG